MSSPGDSRASDPILLLSSSPQAQRAAHTAAAPSAGARDDASAIDLDTQRVRPRVRPKREPESSEGDTDSDLSIRRTRAFRMSSGDRPSSSSGGGSSRSASRTPGTPSNPIVLDESPRQAVQPRQDLPPGASLMARELAAERMRSYADGDPPPVSRTASQTGQTVSRRRSSGAPPIPAPVSTRTARLPSVALPRWQPDAEVTYCPICHTQFSFFVRKHHCRKCGRVVCDACSPHRITIPYQYIVQPPSAPRLSRGEYPASLIAGAGGYADSGGLGGGERVRLCNPCVPDPNTTPPQAQAQPAASASSGLGRSQSTANRPQAHPTPLINRLSAYMGAYSQTPDQYRSRSVTMGNHSTPASPGQNPPSYDARRAPAPARPGPGPSSGSSPAVASGSAPGSSSRNRALPAVPRHSHPRRQIAEEDECPVCHRELPSRALPGFETRREEHITACIVAHSSGSGTPTRRGGGLVAASPGGSGQSSAPAPQQPQQQQQQRRTGMFPYKATEKDCVDSAECTICLEEFEVGVDMARLECLCRFHRRCIDAWFERHPGQCPMHQHDGFGF